MDDIRPSSELESTVHLQNQRWLSSNWLKSPVISQPVIRTPFPFMFLDQSKFPALIISVIEIDLRSI